MKPIINLDELEFISNDNGRFSAKMAPIGVKIGAKQLGYNLTVVPPGKTAFPFHCHHNREEMFFVLEGEGVLRHGEKEYPVRKFDVIACPAGKRDHAHQMTNTGKTDLKYLALSTSPHADICEYPDSNKVTVLAGSWMQPDIRAVFKLDQQVDYFEGEKK